MFKIIQFITLYETSVIILAKKMFILYLYLILYWD